MNAGPYKIQVQQMDDSEESKTPNTMIPSEVLRSALKIAYQKIAEVKYLLENST